MGHTTEGQSRAEVNVSPWGSGQPGPIDSWRRTNLPQAPRLHRQLTISDSDLEHCAQTWPEDLEPEETEPKGEKVGKVGVGWGVEMHAAYGEGLVHTRREHLRD